MRDAEALEFEVFVDDEIGAEVVGKQFAVLFFELLDRERFAGFDEGVRDLLEFGEHRLADDRAADRIDFAIDEVRPGLVALGLLHQVAAEQLFVERAGDFGDEDRVVVVLIRLVAWPSSRCASSARLRGRA